MRAFTLIELVIVITILAILAAVAIPAFQNMQKHAKDAATRGALGAMRSAIHLYRMNEIANGRQPGTGGSPTNGCPRDEMKGIEEAGSGVYVMENGIVPDNPWAKTFIPPGAENWVIVILTGTPPRGTIVFPIGGWVYVSATCEIWANTAANGGPITENNF